MLDLGFKVLDLGFRVSVQGLGIGLKLQVFLFYKDWSNNALYLLELISLGDQRTLNPKSLGPG